MILSLTGAQILGSAGTVLAQADGESSVNPLLGWLPLILVGVVLYMLTIRPQKKRALAVREFQANLKPGDEITTAGGIIGVISSLSEHEATVDVGGVKLKFSRGAITAPAAGRPTE